MPLKGNVIPTFGHGSHMHTCQFFTFHNLETNTPMLRWALRLYPKFIPVDTLGSISV